MLWLIILAIGFSFVGTGDASAALDPTSPGHLMDEAAEITDPVNSIIGPYALAALEARRQLGIADTAQDLTQEQDDAVAALADDIILNEVERTSDPTVVLGYNQANRVIDTPVADWPCNIVACAAVMLPSPRGLITQYSEVNEEEKRVCRRYPIGCYRNRHSPQDATQWTLDTYGRSAHNDITDAYRHCIWSAIMVKRADANFAWQFGRAHEFGDRAQPANEMEMDLHNNSQGRDAAFGNEGRTDRWLSQRCKAKADNLELRTLR